jgi:carbamoyltransferase
MDIASSAQAMYEEAFFNLLDALYLKYSLSTLCLAGGCAMNSVANGKILAKTSFKRLYVQSAAGDAGGAIGAAYVVSKQDFPEKNFIMDHAYWGPHFSNEQVKAVIDLHATTLRDQHCTVVLSENEADLMSETAQSIADGKVVGWFQGRMEWGPRALGNRSILGDPRRADMKDILNLKIKRRESFRPFAPSILFDHVKDWFERDDDVPFMMQVYPIREDKRSLVPAVCHVDGSGRLQTVYRDTNPRYHGLIEAFNRLTNVPMILNTSFNENEPVVCTPTEALDCFLRTKMDKLVIGDWVISR